jgi:hypothetical protein
MIYAMVLYNSGLLRYAKFSIACGSGCPFFRSSRFSIAAFRNLGFLSP